MIGQATKREIPTSPLGALLPITFQAPISIKVISSLLPIHLTFFQKLQKCVNEIVGLKKPLYACIAVKGVTVVICIGKSSKSV